MEIYFELRIDKNMDMQTVFSQQHDTSSVFYKGFGSENPTACCRDEAPF